MLRNVLPFGTAALHKNDERKRWLLKEYARSVLDSQQIRFKLFRSVLFSRARSRDESRRSFSLYRTGCMSKSHRTTEIRLKSRIV